MKDQLTPFIGGKEMTARLMDGREEKVFVRQLPIKLIPEIIDNLTDEAAQLSIYLDKPAEWVDALTPESHDALIEEAEGLNADFFERFARRRLARMERLNPGFRERLQASASQAGLPMSATGPASQSIGQRTSPLPS